MTTKAEIVTIGDEILYGQTLDTNAHWMSGALDEIGIKVIRRSTIPDNKLEIIKALKEAEERADVILITGGLGPTNDDLTKPTLVEYFDTKLIHHPEVLKNIEELFARAGREMSQLNISQADLPEICEPIPNKYGTAAGMWFDVRNKIFVSMPGVPYEMKNMMEHYIIPKLSEKFAGEVICHRMIRTVGIPESKLAEKIKDWETNLPEAIKLAYLPTMGMVKLRLTSKGLDQDELLKQIQIQIDNVLPIIEKYVYGYDQDELEVVIGRQLQDSGYMLAIAESCTGGFLSHQITSVPGSSQWFKGSFVPYSNEIKSDQLMVDAEVIKEHGAVSEQVVLALAENVRKTFNSDIAVSISGIAGPSGGTKDKPVGTVWIGYSDEHKTVAKLFQLTKDRNINIKYSAIAALNMIRMNLNKN